MISYMEKFGQSSASLERMGLIYSLAVAPSPCPTACSLHCVKSLGLQTSIKWKQLASSPP